jgi:triacylglycerol lipase
VPVKTLATIGTPHRGSPVVDVVAVEYVPKLPLLAAVLEAAKMNLGNVLEQFGISLEGLHDLTTKAARDFNTESPDHPGVKYLSYAGGGRPGLVPTSKFFLPYYEFIRIRCNRQTQ